MPLKLSLKPGEKFVLNGAVVQNGDRRGVLILQNKASVLREKDIMQPEDVDSPAKRIYFPVMMMYLDETAAPKVYDEFALRLTEFMGATRNPQVLADCVAASLRSCTPEATSPDLPRNLLTFGPPSGPCNTRAPSHAARRRRSRPAPAGFAWRP